MKCPNCGWEGDTNFCENCGTPMPKSQHTGDSSETDDWNPPSPSGAAPWNSAEEQNWDGTSFQQFSSDEGEYPVERASGLPVQVKIILAILVVIFFIIGGVFVVTLAQHNSVDDPKGERLSDGWLSSGSYEVGKDLEPGLYFVEADEDWVSADINGSFWGSDDQYEGFDTFGYILLEEDTELILRGGRMIEADNAPVPEADDGWYGPGMYLVGRDIPAEEYFFLCQEEGGNLSISTYDSCGPEAELLSAASSDSRYFFTPTEDTFIHVRWGIFTTADQALPPEPVNGWYPAGMYRIGEEIPEGIYYCRSDENRTVFADTLSDSNGSSESWLDSWFFDNFGYFALEEGAYLEVSGGEFAAAENAPIPQPVNGVYTAGMYLVGRDIPAGSYQLIPDEDFDAYYEILDAPSTDYEHQLDSGWTDGEEQIIITVEDGTYLNVSYGTFQAAS